jgi:hypothetical protein
VRRERMANRREEYRKTLSFYSRRHGVPDRLPSALITVPDVVYAGRRL